MKFEVMIEPLPQSRPRFNRGRAYESQRTRDYKNCVSTAALAAMKGTPPLAFPLAVKLKFFRHFKATSRRFGDVDNLTKAVLDACNGIVWNDDAQVVKISAEKFSADTPRLEIEIEGID